MPGIDSYRKVLENSGDTPDSYYVLVRRIAFHLSSRLPNTISVEDLIQAGMEGILQAQKSFDSSRGIEFEVFAKNRVRGAMLDEVRRTSFSSRNIVSTKKHHDLTINLLTQKLGRAPKNSEVADALEISLDTYEKERLLTASSDLVSSDDLPTIIEESLERQASPHKQLEDEEQLTSLTEAISQLPERSQQILALYYQEEMNLKEIGAILSVSESRISQILSETATKLRKLLVAY